jgi:hypothetical protein
MRYCHNTTLGFVHIYISKLIKCKNDKNMPAVLSNLINTFLENLIFPKNFSVRFFLNSLFWTLLFFERVTFIFTIKKVYNAINVI